MTTSIKRREIIKQILLDSPSPIKGGKMAERFNVTRQVIVKDIAILRAEGNEIIATPDGYIVNIKNNNRVRKVIAVNHDEAHTLDEMNIIIKFGGIIEDVIVEHPIYGEIRGMLMISNQNELEKFYNKYKTEKAKLLSVLTNGIHLHTISTVNQENMQLIIEELKNKGYIVLD